MNGVFRVHNAPAQYLRICPPTTVQSPYTHKYDRDLIGAVGAKGMVVLEEKSHTKSIGKLELRVSYSASTK